MDTDIVDKLDQRVIFCASCVDHLVRPLEVVSKGKLEAALAEVKRAKGVEAQAAEFAAEAKIEKARADVLEGQLQMARSQVASLEGTVRELSARATAERKQALLVAVAPAEPKPTRKAKAAA